ncbi:glycosyltransferase family 4 protein [Methanobrevibacter filiformis]|uniref:Alpha-D-kanosaminyltransferase n=1 Tax=Methanobrevibacter filiformis TaxID=55758 RepID=A0A166CKB7_9EURY|nr:glycosyltransferase family 4 protein [Methanobrevibacter filiformis]KZX14600.1 alpha-D-kanosaminyltransferase [Methanobrevibacter filiformis]
MKIAMVGQFPPHIGGVSTHVLNLSKELIKKGHEVYVVTYPQKNLKDIGKIHVNSTYGINIKGLRSLFFIIFGTIKLVQIVKKHDIDIIHGHYLFPPGLIAILGGFFTKKKVYITAHGSDIFNLYKNKGFMRPILKFILKKAYKVLVVSEALKEEIIKINIKGIEEKVRINLNAVDINKFKPDNSYLFKKELIKDYDIIENQAIILYVGRLDKEKNVESLIEAKKHLKTPSTLVIVGYGPLENNLKEKIKKEKISNVIFTGKRKDIENIIPSSDILVLPSFYESFGIVLIEALSCGKPVIGSDIKSIRSIITEDVGLLIDPNNTKDITNKIDLILTNKDLKKKMEKNARQRALLFSKIQIPYDMNI